MYNGQTVQAVANVFHSALHDCWKIGKGGDPVHSGNLRSQCEAIYKGGSHGGETYPQTDPWDISPWNPHYICFGQWDNTDPPNAANNYAGTGFVGRCWADWPVSSAGVVCGQKTCDIADGTWSVKTVGSNTYYYKNVSGVGQQCLNVLQYRCDGGGSLDLSKNNPSCPGNQRMEAIWVDQADNTTACDPTSSATTANDCENKDPGGCFAYGSPGDDPCVEQAEEDYCRDIAVPEVIDPTDLPPGSDGTVWGIGAAIIDAGVYGQMGVEKPLMTMKGFVKYEMPTEQETDDLGRPDGPRGVLFDKAGLLNLGVMAFRENGAKTECNKFAETCLPRNSDNKFTICETDPNSVACEYCTARQSIEKYCPDPNYDGAFVLTGIDAPYIGADPDTGTPENWGHYNEIVSGINDQKATSWTPLAEAMYTAIGYFGQRSDRCLNKDASDNCLDFPIEGSPVAGIYDTPKDPVEYWCQDNHVLLITEGASTADINQAAVDFSTNIIPNALNNAQIPVALGTDSAYVDGECSSGLEGSTFLDDLTYYGHNANAGTADAVKGIYEYPQIDTEDKQNITTHIISLGTIQKAAATDTEECKPDRLMSNAAVNGGGSYLNAEDPSQLSARFSRIVSDILARASAGSAASVISSSRSGSGAVYQAIFWPQLRYSDSSTNSEWEVEWVGDVHSLFLNAEGFLYEDSNQDGRLEPSADEGTDGLDRRMVFFYNEDAQRSMACYKISDYFTNGVCPGIPTNKDASCDGVHCAEFEDINYIWSANNWLQDITIPAESDAGEDTNRDPYLSWSKERYIFTWNDLNNNGMVDSGEQLPFTGAALVPATPLNVTPDTTADAYFGTPPSRGSVIDDFGITDVAAINRFVAGDINNKGDAVKTLINWIRGIDYSVGEDINADGVIDAEDVDLNGNGRVEEVLRSRDFKGKIWRLGDVIHSTPTVVAKPPEAYHFIYKDPTYSLFADRYAKRRQVVYFGGNDGMLHAINAGFFHEGTNAFCRKLNEDYDLTDDVTTNDNPCADGPELGAELWAYVPYNLIPHLSCLADPEYDHKFFVDQRPRIFDAQIFADDCTYSSGADCSQAIHPGGWGTILVGSMRFGGADLDARDINGMSEDERHFGSSYFILDITDPEQPPELLGEMTMLDNNSLPDNPVTTDLAYTTPSPTLVVMRYKAGLPQGATRWYLIMGNGPEELDGTNNQRGKLAIYPLEYLQGGTTAWSWKNETYFTPDGPLESNKRPFRIPDKQPGTADHQSKYEAGIYHIPGPDYYPSFISDLITVDFDIENQAPIAKLGALYNSDAVYFGTVDGSGFTTYPPPDADDTKWNGGGRLFRMVTRYESGGIESASEPDKWNDGETYAGGDYHAWNHANGSLSHEVRLQDGTSIRDWANPYNMLIDAKGPITGAPAVGWDGYAFWVYFGTGRFFDIQDKTDAQTQRFFGIREPVDISGTLECSKRRPIWTTLDWDLDTDNILNINPALAPGHRGLLRTDDIEVAEYATSLYDVPFLTCQHCTEDPDDSEGDGDYVTCDNTLSASDCFPDTLVPVQVPDITTADTEDKVSVYTFFDLNKYIAGTSCKNGIDGWVRETHDPRERHLGQAALLGGLLTYTSYIPYSDVCKSEGRSFLYGIHYQSGTAWYENVFGTYTINGNKYVKARLGLGSGLATTPSLHVGSGANDSTAFVQTSTGEIIEIGQENLPLSNFKSGRTSWIEESE